MAKLLTTARRRRAGLGTSLGACGCQRCKGRDAHPPCDAKDFEAIPGLGIRASVAGQDVLIGSQRLLQARGIVTDALHSKAHDLALQGKSAIFAAIEGSLPLSLPCQMH